jgi:hypothetical protein
VLEFNVDGSPGTIYVLNPDQLIEKIKQKQPNLPIDPDKKTSFVVNLASAG